MKRFLQLHLLTFYPPSNLNRDDTGQPKSAIIGGASRLRQSSQSLKRAWRTSEIFQSKLEDHRGDRTQRLGAVIVDHLKGKGLAADKALEIAREIAGAFGKVKAETDKNPAYTEQLAFISREERAAALAYAEKRAAGEKAAESSDLADLLLRKIDTAADIAMFGRMLADSPDFNREAAVQVAHAFTTHQVTVDDDYYTASDDLKKKEEDAGAGFIGETGFGSGVYYLYINIDRALLVKNLGGDKDVARKAVEALVEAAATVGPRGMSARFASFARTHFIIAEAGNVAPRTLAAAFEAPVRGAQGHIAGSIKALETLRERFAKAYGEDTDCRTMDIAKGEGSLKDIVAFAVTGL
ncbi:type I-E CRISPR-associated protein Cas7/Cse4/CasC [Nordella sp. HKS 07]|uniref:type I-E CRISPR-associated protein Cas7/Cse4/CasC n=1 Tax=Nordella sp. HKS 07 TaxID=2712222 RepID=UPI0013E1888F|nr:type I-E CRISPR-associated protein Cas7/Cse4/CasC [Nordella sp. HKS 07]QIG50141.1 type I-E CRISPR-associated protein Cas7/Cse4/CasC [Nordella sp. HKS 07]